MIAVTLLKTGDVSDKLHDICKTIPGKIFSSSMICFLRIKCKCIVFGQQL